MRLRYRVFPRGTWSDGSFRFGLLCAGRGECLSGAWQSRPGPAADKCDREEHGIYVCTSLLLITGTPAFQGHSDRREALGVRVGLRAVVPGHQGPCVPLGRGCHPAPCAAQKCPGCCRWPALGPFLCLRWGKSDVGSPARIIFPPVQLGLAHPAQGHGIASGRALTQRHLCPPRRTPAGGTSVSSYVCLAWGVRTPGPLC